jgi:hypothetical protein
MLPLCIHLDTKIIHNVLLLLLLLLFLLLILPAEQARERKNVRESSGFQAPEMAFAPSLSCVSCKPKSCFTTQLSSQFGLASSPNARVQLLILGQVEERHLCLRLYVSSPSSSSSPHPGFLITRKHQLWSRHKGRRSVTKWWNSHEPAGVSKGLPEIYDLCSRKRAWEGAAATNSALVVKTTPTAIVRNWVANRLAAAFSSSSSPQKMLPSEILMWVVTIVIAVVVMSTGLEPSNALVMAPRKLQGDELATVQLFQENTPSVVYITNLAVRRDVFTLDVMAVPQGSGSGFIWDKKGHIVTNYHVIRGASDLRYVRLPSLSSSSTSSTCSSLPISIILQSPDCSAPSLPTSISL